MLARLARCRDLAIALALALFSGCSAASERDPVYTYCDRLTACSGSLTSLPGGTWILLTPGFCSSAREYVRRGELAGFTADYPREQFWFPSLERCSDVHGCTDYVRCTQAGVGHEDCVGRTGTHCAGEVLVDCTDSYLARGMDCSLIGLHCVERDGAAACSDGSMCEPGEASHCQDDHVAVRCDPDTALRARYDCARFGQRCAGSGNTIRCVSSRPACTTAGALCDGNIHVRCDGEFEWRTDCDTVSPGSTCDPLQICAIASVPPGACRPHCDGTVAVFCTPGGDDRVDCVAAGYSTCTEEDDGFPHCPPPT